MDPIEKEGPEGTWWLGGVDGGSFVKVEDDENNSDRIYSGVVYYDNEERSLAYKGRLRLKGEFPFDPTDKEHYEVWDGENLHLKDGAYLEVLDPFPKN